jgi:hypothetical protein
VPEGNHDRHPHSFASRRDRLPPRGDLSSRAHPPPRRARDAAHGDSDYDLTVVVGDATPAFLRLNVPLGAAAAVGGRDDVVELQFLAAAAPDTLATISLLHENSNFVGGSPRD